MTFTCSPTLRLFQEYVEFQVQLRFDETLHKDVVRFCLQAGERRPSEEERDKPDPAPPRPAGQPGCAVRGGSVFVGAEGLIRSREALKTPAIVDLRGR